MGSDDDRDDQNESDDLYVEVSIPGRVADSCQDWSPRSPWGLPDLPHDTPLPTQNSLNKLLNLYLMKIYNNTIDLAQNIVWRNKK